MYTRLLARLYTKQTANVVTDKVSKEFRIGRGTKQGDPISPELYNAVLEKTLRRAKESWGRKGWGLRMEGGMDERLTNLRFADDILLIATSRDQLKSMIEDLEKYTAEVGLEIHMGKTKVLTNEVRKQGWARITYMSTGIK